MWKRTLFPLQNMYIFTKSNFLDTEQNGYHWYSSLADAYPEICEVSGGFDVPKWGATIVRELPALSGTCCQLPAYEGSPSHCQIKLGGGSVHSGPRRP